MKNLGMVIVVPSLVAGCSGPGLVTTPQPAVPSASPFKTDFAAAVRRATEVVTGRRDLLWLPSLTTGFTDARLVRPLGATIYGFGLAHPDSDPNFPSGVHGANENTEIRGLLFQTKLFIALACDVLKAQVK